MITWTNERRKLRDLIPWEQNPREINTKEAQRLGDSLEEFGQIQTIAIGPDDEIYDGHQRKAVWSLLPQFGPDHEVDVRVSSRALTEKERQKLVVYLHRGTMGQWDWDALANTFEVPELLEWGFSDYELQIGEIDTDYTPGESENKGFRSLVFSLLPEQLEAVEQALEQAKQEGVEYPGNKHELSNALYLIACDYVS